MAFDDSHTSRASHTDAVTEALVEKIRRKVDAGAPLSAQEARLILAELDKAGALLAQGKHPHIVLPPAL
jgi:hypothetical protein